MYGRPGYEVLLHEGTNRMPDPPKVYRLANALLRGKLSDMMCVQFVTIARPAAGVPDTPAVDQA